MPTAWSGRAAQQARAIVATWLPMACGQCGEPVHPGTRWVVGHKIPRAVRPDLTWDVANWQPEHRACSDRTAQSVVQQAAAHRALHAAGLPLSSQPAPGQPPTCPSSLSPASGDPVEVREGLRWSVETMLRHSWLAEFAVVPENAAPPLAMTPPHPEAVGSYGGEAVAWIESSQRITLRWWQRLVIVRQLEHREDGSLCWRTLVESGPRRIGKSVRIRGLALWRMAHADLFGERQEVVHTGSDLAVCRKVQKDAWRWGEAQGWAVTRGNGKEAMETSLGDTWLVRSQSAVYGWDTTYGVVDEGWDVKPDTVSEGLEPSLMERLWAQLHMTSTAHRRATSLMPSWIGDALAAEDGSTLLMLWAAPYGADVGDPAVWKAASPHWSADRARTIAAKYSKARRGEQDPEFDDADPMAGFNAQYLNMWPRVAEKARRGEPVVDEATWAGLVEVPPVAVPDAAAVESWYAEGVSVAVAWRVADRVVVAVSDHPDLGSAVDALRESGFRGVTVVGKSLMTDPALQRVRKKAGEGRTVQAVQDLRRLLGEDAVRHDGAEHLSGQVLGVRTLPGADGPRVVSQGRADAVKAAVWAAGRARTRSGSVRIIAVSSA